MDTSQECREQEWTIMFSSCQDLSFSPLSELDVFQSMLFAAKRKSNRFLTGIFVSSTAFSCSWYGRAVFLICWFILLIFLMYVDGFVLPVPKNKIAAYKKMATLAAKVWKEHGALQYAECQGDDLKVDEKWMMAFPTLVKPKK